MGNNIDLCELMGLPEHIRCPRCRRTIRSYFEDFDIECGHNVARNGTLSLSCYCNKCDNEFEVDVHIDCMD